MIKSFFRDAFPWFFHREKIGPIVGTRTWGDWWAWGATSRCPMEVSSRPPGFGFWGTHNGGEWVVKQRGVDPDYVVPQRPELIVSGHDLQLEKAIELANEALKSYKAILSRPKYASVKE